VGIDRVGDGFGIRATINRNIGLPQKPGDPLTRVASVPIEYVEVRESVRAAALLVDGISRSEQSLQGGAPVTNGMGYAVIGDQVIKVDQAQGGHALQDNCHRDHCSNCL
jgi:hypothetical protein